jgi:CrcB protein
MDRVDSRYTMKIILLVGLGGFIGSVARHLTVTVMTKLFPSAFPYGTFTANIVGCLIIGLFYGLSERLGWLTPPWRFFLVTGLCGGYTTFSSFAYENMTLLKGSDYGTFALYTVGSLSMGLLAVWGGITLAKI